MKKMSLAILALLIAGTAAIATKTMNANVIYRFWAPIGTDITDPSSYLVIPASNCYGYGTQFCGIKAIDDLGYPSITPALQADLVAIQNGTNPASNKSGLVKFVKP